MDLIYIIIVFSLIGGIFSTLGGVLLLYKEETAKKLSIHLISFAAGTLLAAAFFDLLPESAEAFSKNGDNVEKVFNYALFGLLFFFVIEGVLFKLHHHHEHGNEDPCNRNQYPKKETPLLLFIGDSIHNLLDGIAIAISFLVSIPLGITTSIAVASHEIPQEIGEFSIMLREGWSKRKILFLNLASALMTTVGAVLAYFLRGAVENIVGHLLAFTAGLFIYISTADLVPELYHSSRGNNIARTVLTFFIGIFTIFAITNFL